MAPLLSSISAVPRRAGLPERHRSATVRRQYSGGGSALHHPTKISKGRKADTTKLGTSTTWLIFRSTATLQMQ